MQLEGRPTHQVWMFSAYKGRLPSPSAESTQASIHSQLSQMTSGQTHPDLWTLAVSLTILLEVRFKFQIHLKPLCKKSPANPSRQLDQIPKE